MTGAIVLGLILVAGGAVLDSVSLPRDEDRRAGGVNRFFLLRAGLEPETKFLRTALLLQALGTVLATIGLLAWWIRSF